MTKLGDLYNYITIQTVTLSDSSVGKNSTETWSTYTSCWAEIVNDSGNELILSDQKTAKTMTTWRIRYDSGVTQKMRISFDSDYYEIIGIQREGRNKFLTLKTFKIE